MLNNTTDSLLGVYPTSSHPQSPPSSPTPTSASTPAPPPSPPPSPSPSTPAAAMSSWQHTAASATTTTTTFLVAVADDPVERTAIGIPVKLLWVPYIVFTLVIICLIMVSFCKYHRKNGHKYRRRRLELFGQGVHHHHATSSGGVPHQLPRGCATTGIVNRLPPNGGAPSAACCNADAASTSASARPRGGCGAGAGTSDPTNSSSTVKKKPKPRRKPKPLTFMRNANGSMVDLRCGERNSMNIFKTPFSTHADSSIWTLPRHGGAYRTLNSPTGNYFSDDDDDDVLLIHSTKL